MSHLHETREIYELAKIKRTRKCYLDTYIKNEENFGNSNCYTSIIKYILNRQVENRLKWGCFLRIVVDNYVLHSLQAVTSELSRTNVASVGSVFNDTRKVKVLSLPETIKDRTSELQYFI